MTGFNITNREGSTTISVFLEDGQSKVIPSTSLTYGPLVAYLTGNAEHDEAEVKRLIDPSVFIGSQMSEIAGDRVRYDNRQVYFDGKPLTEGLLATHVKQKIEAGDDDWKRLVRFLLNLDENPSFQAQKATYEWVTAHGLTLTEDGCFLGYKAVLDDHTSSSTGPDNYIDGAYFGLPGVSYHVPHKVGSVVSKKRADVDDKPGGGCSVGLHVGTYNYAKNFAPVLMTVKVNPRDVVSASDGNLAIKIRVCRYEVVALNEDKVDFIGSVASVDYNRQGVSDTTSTVEESPVTQPETPLMSAALESVQEEGEKGWSIVSTDNMGLTVHESFYDRDAALEALQDYQEREDQEAQEQDEEPTFYQVRDPEGTLGLFQGDFDSDDEVTVDSDGTEWVDVTDKTEEPQDDGLSPQEQAELDEVRAALDADDSGFVDEPNVGDVADEEGDTRYYSSLGEAAGDPEVLADLQDVNIGHKPFVAKWGDRVVTTESSVRRWRKSNGVVLA